MLSGQLADKIIKRITFNQEAKHGTCDSYNTIFDRLVKITDKLDTRDEDELVEIYLNGRVY